MQDNTIKIDDKEAAIARATLQVGAVVDLPTVASRPAMFTLLLDLLFARPIPDDMLLMNYLQMKYKVNMQVDVESLAMDLVVGAFDILSSAAARKEPDDFVFALKSFLINKVPLLLSTLSTSMFSTDRMEYCIGQALSRVNHIMFPAPSLSIMSENPLLGEVRQEFLFSCTLHSLLRDTSIETLLGEPPTFSKAPDPSARYVKETLVEQCVADSERISQLIDELDKLNGNAATISLALVDVSMSNFCANHCTKPFRLFVIFA